MHHHSQLACRCHKVPLVGTRRWRCAVRAARDARYEASTKGKATRARNTRRRYGTEAYRAARQKYFANASGAYGRWRALQRRIAEFRRELMLDLLVKQQAEREAWKEGQPWKASGRRAPAQEVADRLAELEAMERELWASRGRRGARRPDIS
jgi:hypothetical protein